MGNSCTGNVDGDPTRTTQAMRDRILKTMEPLEPYSTSELADSLGEPRRTVLYNLNRLAEDGEIVKKPHNPNNVTWFRSE